MRAPAYRAPPTFDAANGVAAPAAAPAVVPAHRRSASGGVAPPPPATAASSASCGTTAPGRPARPQSAASRPPPTAAASATATATATAAAASGEVGGDAVTSTSLQREVARGAGYHPLFKLTETACLALSNVVFHCADNQARSPLAPSRAPTLTPTPTPTLTLALALTPTLALALTLTPTLTLTPSPSPTPTPTPTPNPSPNPNPDPDPDPNPHQLAALELGVLDPCLRLLQRPSSGANRAVQVAAYPQP